MTDRPDRVSALDARDDLLAIAAAWPDLLARLGRDGNRAPDGMPKPATKTRGLVINEHVSQLMADVRDWTVFLARQLVDEVVDTNGNPWQPPAGADTPTLLSIIARERIGHFANHPDEGLRGAFHDDAKDLRARVTRTAYPDGIRTRTTAIPCDTDQCPGHYTFRARADGTYPDLICNHNTNHRVPPSEWARRTWGARHTTLDAYLAPQKYIRAADAATMLNVSTSTLHVIAHRHAWARQGHGKNTTYALDDVQAAADARAERPPTGDAP